MTLGSALIPTPPSEGVRIYADVEGSYPVEVFGDHGLCAGQSTQVFTMSGPHMHSQVELNMLSSGRMTYWFDGREITLQSGQLAVFWGMIPHQVTHCDEGTQFVVIYAPMSQFIELSGASQLREAIFRGAFLLANHPMAYDVAMFQRWREDLMSGDKQVHQIVRDELMARARRIERDSWVDLRQSAMPASGGLELPTDHDRAVSVETMVRFISEHALEDIAAHDVAKSAGLHPNYAMALYKRGIGLTIKQSITRQRLDAAQSMLIATDKPVATLAFACGFGSISSFYAAFEKRFGTSPQSFRANIRAHQLAMAEKA